MSAILEVPHLSDLDGLSLTAVPGDEPGVVSVTAWANDGSIVTMTWDEIAGVDSPEALRFNPEDVLARIADHGDLAADLLHPDRPELPLADEDPAS